MKKLLYVFMIAGSMIFYQLSAINISKNFNDGLKSANNSMNKSLTSAQDTLQDLVPDMQNPITYLKELIRKKYPVKQVLSDDQLQVRQGVGISQKEVNFIMNRTPKVTQALQKNFDIQAPIKIGLAFSGGGNRAMLVSLGFLLGAEDIGLYDSSYYMAGLSGSSWTLVPFSYLSAKQGMSLTGFKDQLVGRLGSVMKVLVPGTRPVPVFSAEQNRVMQNSFLKRFAYDQYISSIDLYGAFIGDFTLLPAGKNRLDLMWSSIADTIEKGNIPFPMGSAIADHASGRDNYYWFEVSPFEVGSDQVNAYVPIQSFGSKFKKGKLVSNHKGHTQEYPMSFYQGVFGSAFVFSMNEMDRLPFPQIKINLLGIDRTVSLADAFAGFDSNQWLSNNLTKDVRFFPACFHNYTYELEGNPLAKDEKLKLYDAGLNFDLPLPMVMRPARGLDIIFACDAMIDLQTLQLAEVHFKRNNIKFPAMTSVTEADISKPLTIFNDPRSATYDKDMITLAYCPFIKNDGFSKTFDPVKCREEGFCTMLNFNYTQEQADQVIGVTRYNVNAMKNEITDVLHALQTKKSEKFKPALAIRQAQIHARTINIDHKWSADFARVAKK